MAAETLPGGPANRLARAYRAVRPPFDSPRFWVVQAAVVAIAALHDFVLVWLGSVEGPLEVPGPVTSVLLFVPVLYAALNFGMRGAVGTAVLSTLFIIPHWLMSNPLGSVHVWVEAGNLVVLNAVAVVVGIRVERERAARQHAEDALTSAEVATARYHALFGEHPAAVIITDGAGTVTETNAAAATLFGGRAAGAPLARLLGQDMPALLAGLPILSLTTSAGEERLYSPSAHVIQPDATTRLIQVCLVDITEQHRRQEEQRQFGARLLAVQEEERRRLAHELHDDPLQTLTFLARALDDLAGDTRLPDDLSAQVHRDAGLATDVGQVLRAVIRGLRPPVLDDLGLLAAVRQLVGDAEARPDAPAIGLHVQGAPVRLPARTELTAYRVVQESLSNVMRHADARCADVRLAFADELTVSVTDNGRGLRRGANSVADGGSRPAATDEAGAAATTLTGPGTGLGLIGMRERVVAVGGRIEVRDRRGRGTEVRAVLPLTLPKPSGEPPGDPHRRA